MDAVGYGINHAQLANIAQDVAEIKDATVEALGINDAASSSVATWSSDKVSAELAKDRKENYMISTMPVFFDSRKFSIAGFGQATLGLLDVRNYALCSRYGYKELYRVSLDTLEQTKLFDYTPAGSLDIFSAKIIPKNDSYDYVIAFNQGDYNVYRFSTNGVVQSALTGHNVGWLKNTGFDLSVNASGYASGTMIYAEYILDTFTNYAAHTVLNVWRSTDLGATWTSVFTQNGRNHVTPQIFHFHVVRKDPYNAGHWYLSSGDHEDECHIWRSIDDGLTWTLVDDPQYTGAQRKLHQLTNMFFTPDYIYWGIDENITGMGSPWVKADRNLADSHLIITSVADVKNWVRNVTQTPYGLVILTETRTEDSGNGLIWLVPYSDLDNPILIGKTEGSSYGGQICDYSFGSRIFLDKDGTTGTYKQYPINPSDCRFHILTLSRMVRG